MAHNDQADGVCDERMERRLKRRRLVINDFEINTRIKRASEDSQLDDEMVDEDYQFHLNHLEENDGDEEGDVDPQYRMFLERLKKDGTSYVLESAIKSERSVFVKYEAETSSDDECINLRNVSKRVKVEAGRDVGSVHSKEKVETQNNSEDVLIKNEMENPKNLRNVPDRERKSSVATVLKSAPKDKSLSEPEGAHVMEDGEIDECYAAFLMCIKQEGDSLVLLVDEDGQRVIYEDDTESPDSEILVTDNAPSCDEGNYTPFVRSRKLDSCMEGDDWQYIGSPSESKYSEFRKKLMIVLKRPYDQKEYEELLHEVNGRKPIEGRRELRGGIKSYAADTYGKSYLDHHTDLKKKIKAARYDRCKVLYLLRGFFYWLQGFCPTKNLKIKGSLSLSHSISRDQRLRRLLSSHSSSLISLSGEAFLLLVSISATPSYPSEILPLSSLSQIGRSPTEFIPRRSILSVVRQLMFGSGTWKLLDYFLSTAVHGISR